MSLLISKDNPDPLNWYCSVRRNYNWNENIQQPSKTHFTSNFEENPRKAVIRSTNTVANRYQTVELNGNKWSRWQQRKRRMMNFFYFGCSASSKKHFMWSIKKNRIINTQFFNFLQIYICTKRFAVINETANENTFHASPILWVPRKSMKSRKSSEESSGKCLRNSFANKIYPRLKCWNRGHRSSLVSVDFFVEKRWNRCTYSLKQSVWVDGEWTWVKRFPLKRWK